FEHVTWTEVDEAIRGASMKTAPGFSQMSYLAIKWAWDVGSEDILLLIHQCLAVGYHPKRWCRAVVVALRKPNKPDYSNPRAYRLIALPECLGKILE
ncbi:uncharacterized protein BT62DRAFT_877834, partial [Guyanagaster necrorhizus]